MVTTTRDAERQTVNMPTAFKMLGISRPVGYDLARRGALPVPVIRMGNRMVVSKRALEAVLNATKPNDGNDAVPA
jgi:predicted DNA-binding transcriptional regulator AlpA